MAAGPASRAPLAAIAMIAIIPALLHLTIVATSGVKLTLAPHLAELFKLGFVTASAAMHWLIYGSLLMTFALTLRPGREPLITNMARRLHGAMPDEMARYTRRVTIAWCCFFAAQLTTSILLFCFAPLVVWSFFVNILDLPLVAAMFAAEYMVRLRVLRDPPKHSLAVIFNMVAECRKPREEAAHSL